MFSQTLVCTHTMLSLTFSPLIFFLSLSLQIMQGMALSGVCSQIQPGLPVFSNFGNFSVSASGPLPYPGQCKSWSLTINYVNSSTPQCTSPSSTLMLEFWITNADLTPIDPQLTIPGIYMMASRNSSISTSPPMVYVSSEGSSTYSPVQAPGYTPTDQLLQFTYVDSSSAYNSLPSQRFLVPVGGLFDSYNINSQTWFLSLQNTNTQPLSYPGIQLFYAIRATCMPISKLPCARPSPSLWECNQPWSASNGTTAMALGTGICMQDNSASKHCICNASQAGSSCNIPVTPITNFQNLSVVLPGRSWRYFQLNIAPSSTIGSVMDARLLAQIVKPANVYSQLQPILLLSARSNGSGDQAVYDLPGVTSISSLGYNLYGDCTCDNCPCYIPYQAELINYAGGHFTGNITNSWWLALYNGAPYQGPVTSSSPALQLSVQWTTSPILNGAAPLCPNNCSGQGVCVNPPQYGPNYQQPLYQCNCNSGFGGPYCQGALQVNQISNTFPTIMASLPAGQWMYYSFVFEPNSMPNWDGSATFMWSLGMNPDVLVVLSSMYLNSMGQLYFMPDTSLVFNQSDPNYFKFYNLVPQQLNWVIGFLNSAASTSSPASISVGVSISNTSGSSLNFVNTLQIALIASVAGLIVLLILFMTVRLLMLRRVLIANTRRAALEVQVSGMQDGSGVAATQRAPVNRGVPSNIAATFLTFKFQSATYVASKSRSIISPTTIGVLQEVPAVHEQQEACRVQQKVSAEQGTTTVAPGVKEPAALLIATDGSGGGNHAAGSAAGSSVGENEGHGGDKVACESRSDVQTETNGGASDSDSDLEHNLPQCSICICDFEEGEELRRLPCNHDYHKTCIDAWMAQHSTCPNCRRALWTGAVDGTPARSRRRRGTRSHRSRPAAAAPEGTQVPLE
ncbi:hypothetical protein CEUSTIGMA_g2301.t1 [Chlamydomonas eustigma]|uniref:RING-type E3 ubiquitin transferase n=1 Tax=Chlamydomonas eustigma TaxID=1157962 RepID=A0A250WVN1_9CHLO|nr:hypothetical protein CEUSTIGMA_g2301.t1 [Chlamydomonas eustigma]|eukprot:GAX74855.1 hypothetical protein CEUSTIGMA_g2301.t1 [Chlamydomonas eustigma]